MHGGGGAWWWGGGVFGLIVSIVGSLVADHGGPTTCPTSGPIVGRVGRVGPDRQARLRGSSAVRNCPSRLP